MKLKYLFLFAAANLLACAPNLGKSIIVTSIPLVTIEHKVPLSNTARARVGEFTDARTDLTAAEIDGRKLPADGDVGSAVVLGFEQALRDSGVQLVLFDAPSVSGQIKEWKVNVNPKFPASDITATAELEVSVKDISGNNLYAATYTGEMAASDMFANETKVKKILGLAMSQAIQQAVEDSVLVERLRQASILK